MEIEIIRDADSLQSLVPEWDRLWKRCPSATPFQSPAWQLSWWKYFGQRGTLLASAIREKGSLKALWPLSVDGSAEARTLIMNGMGISDYLDVLIAPDHKNLGAELMRASLMELWKEWDLCDFQDLRPESPLLAWAVPEGMIFEVSPLQACPVVALPASYDRLLTIMSSHHRRSLRRAHRLLSGAGEYRIEKADHDTLGESLDALFRLHRARWIEQSLPGVLNEPTIQNFHRDVAACMLGAGCLRLYRLVLNDRIISVLYLFTNATRSFCYLGGFDPASERFSPGVILIQHAIQEAITEGKQDFDFLRGSEAYKYLWGAQDRWNYRMVIKKK